MKRGGVQTRLRRRQVGFTLLELSVAMGILLVLGVTLISMVQGHTRFMEMFRQQTFLTAEAPRIGNMLGRILNQSDHFFVYASKEDAMNLAGDPTPRSPGQLGTAVRLFFKSANQETTARVIAVETTSLRFYYQQPGAPPDGPWSSWVISGRIREDSHFTSESGILIFNLFGPNGEALTYCGGAR